MISMTGYAYQENSEQDFSISVEIKSCNNRYLDIFVNIPPWLSSLESKIRDKISGCCNRGKIDVYIRIREQNVPVNIKINTAAAKVYFNAINNLAEELGMDEKCRLSSLLEMDGVLGIEKNRDDERYWTQIEPLLNKAVLSFVSEREREGSHTQENVLSNLEKIISSLKVIIDYVPVIESNIKENIKMRFAEVLGNQIDENRILAETASQLVKCTISEEISRLSSHLNEFLAETERSKCVGKKLDFLSQEINREINTIGSKSTIIEVSAEAVKMKEALENIREQLRNVE